MAAAVAGALVGFGAATGAVQRGRSLLGVGGAEAVEIKPGKLKGKTAIADYMVVASGNSQRQVSTMAEHLRKKLKSLGIKNVAVEGMSQGDWVLIDGGDVIVHLFRPEIREFYELEKLWGDPMPRPGQVA